MSCRRFKSYMVFAAVFAFIFISGLGPAPGCGDRDALQAENGQESEKKTPVKLVYVDWASETASAHVVKAVIEQRLNRECELLSVSLIAMWEALAAGDQDCSVAAWLPSLQKRYYQKHESEVENLGPNLEGTRIGLVVPEYVGIDSIGELSSHAHEFGNKIIGIDPYAGIMEKTQEAVEAYGLEKFGLVSGSGPTMTAVLEKAISGKKWIVVTGWTPHWKFAEWDLKYLEDPKGVYGDKEHIATVVRKGLQSDMPEVYEFLDRFYWTPADMEKVMLMARNSETSYADAAEKWIKENKALVSTWVGK